MSRETCIDRWLATVRMYNFLYGAFGAYYGEELGD